MQCRPSTHPGVRHEHGMQVRQHESVVLRSAQRLAVSATLLARVAAVWYVTSIVVLEIDRTLIDMDSKFTSSLLSVAA